MQFYLVFGLLNVVFAGLYPPTKSVRQNPLNNKTSEFPLGEGVTPLWVDGSLVTAGGSINKDINELEIV